MEIEGKVAIATGGASGIGANSVEQLLSKGARSVLVADLHEGGGFSGQAQFMYCNATQEAYLQQVVAQTKKSFGQVDIFYSNAGALGEPGGLDLKDAVWERMWKLHVLAHVWVARAVIPERVERDRRWIFCDRLCGRPFEYC